MTLFDDTNTHYSDSSSTTTLTEQPTSETQAEQAKPVDQSEGEDTKSSVGSDDFASALEDFTTETEEAAGDDKVIRGTVLKITPTHVVVDIGAGEPEGGFTPAGYPTVLGQTCPRV